MRIETKFNIGDKVWAIHYYDCKKYVPCDSCNGEGGANIPDTKIRVECKMCDGTGEVNSPNPKFDVRHAKIQGISVDVSYRDPPNIRYRYGFYFPEESAGWQDGIDVVRGNESARESNIFCTEPEAEQRAEQLCKQAAENPISY